MSGIPRRTLRSAARRTTAHAALLTGSLLLLGLTGCMAGSEIDPEENTQNDSTGPNAAPTAEISATSAQVFVGQTIELDGSGSEDPDGDPLRYSWTLLAPLSSDTELSDPDGATTLLTPDIPGTYAIRLVVEDEQTTSDPASLMLTVRREDTSTNRPPSAAAGPDLTGAVGQEIILDGTGSDDPDGDELTYAWSWLDRPDGSAAELLDADGATARFTPDVPGRYQAQLEVGDGIANVSDDVALQISDDSGNQPPTADAGEAQTVVVGTAVTLDGSASGDVEDDAAGTPLAFAWSLLDEPSGSSVTLEDGDSAAATFTPQQPGPYVFELVVTDSQGATDRDEVTITAEDAGPDCLIISEYIEGSGGDNKALELYNCGQTTIELGDYGICQVNNAGPDCDYQFILEGTLAPGDVHTVCKSTDTSEPGDPVAALAANCAQTDPAINHNGDDRYLVFSDDDTSMNFTEGTDTIVDALGQRDNYDDSKPWGDVTLRRCNFTPYDGTGLFEVMTYYTSHPKDDASHFGTEPTEGCD